MTDRGTVAVICAVGPATFRIVEWSFSVAEVAPIVVDVCIRLSYRGD